MFKRIWEDLMNVVVYKNYAEDLGGPLYNRLLEDVQKDLGGPNEYNRRRDLGGLFILAK